MKFSSAFLAATLALSSAQATDTVAPNVKDIVYILGDSISDAGFDSFAVNKGLNGAYTDKMGVEPYSVAPYSRGTYTDGKSGAWGAYLQKRLSESSEVRSFAYSGARALETITTDRLCGTDLVANGADCTVTIPGMGDQIQQMVQYHLQHEGNPDARRRLTDQASDRVTNVADVEGVRTTVVLQFGNNDLLTVVGQFLDPTTPDPNMEEFIYNLVGSFVVAKGSVLSAMPHVRVVVAELIGEDNPYASSIAAQSPELYANLVGILNVINAQIDAYFGEDVFHLNQTIKKSIAQELARNPDAVIDQTCNGVNGYNCDTLVCPLACSPEEAQNYFFTDDVHPGELAHKDFAREFYRQFFKKNPATPVFSTASVAGIGAAGVAALGAVALVGFKARKQSMTHVVEGGSVIPAGETPVASVTTGNPVFEL